VPHTTFLSELVRFGYRADVRNQDWRWYVRLCCTWEACAWSLPRAERQRARIIAIFRKEKKEKRTQLSFERTMAEEAVC
jgi:hypothetical protein